MSNAKLKAYIAKLREERDEARQELKSATDTLTEAVDLASRAIQSGDWYAKHAQMLQGRIRQLEESKAKPARVPRPLMLHQREMIYPPPNNGINGNGRHER